LYRVYHFDTRISTVGRREATAYRCPLVTELAVWWMEERHSATTRQLAELQLQCVARCVSDVYVFTTWLREDIHCSRLNWGRLVNARFMVACMDWTQ